MWRRSDEDLNVLSSSVDPYTRMDTEKPVEGAEPAANANPESDLDKLLAEAEALTKDLTSEIGESDASAESTAETVSVGEENEFGEVDPKPSKLVELRLKLASLVSKLVPTKKQLTMVAGLALVAGMGGGFFYWNSKSGGGHDQGSGHGDDHGGAANQHADRSIASHREEHQEEHPADEHSDASPVATFNDDNWPGSVREFVTQIVYKVKELSHADEENRRLVSENANLRRWVEEIRFECSRNSAEKETQTTGVKLAVETGARLGMALNSIDYRPPSNLLPEQLFTLAVSYFKAEEYEKAAVLFSYLTGMDEDTSFKTPSNYLLTGVSWYRLNHFKLADEFLDKVLSSPAAEGTQEFKAQATLWKALVAQKTDQYRVAQQWLVRLVDRFPRRLEARWVNPELDPSRTPASETSAQETVKHEKISPPGQAELHPSEETKSENEKEHAPHH